MDVSRLLEDLVLFFFDCLLPPGAGDFFFLDSVCSDTFSSSSLQNGVPRFFTTLGGMVGGSREHHKQCLLKHYALLKPLCLFFCFKLLLAEESTQLTGSLPLATRSNKLADQGPGEEET